jgi:hypothetical protein
MAWHEPRAEISRRTFLGTSAAAAAATGLASGAAAQPPAVTGYPSSLSVLPGDRLGLHTSGSAPAFDVAIERIGATRKPFWSRQGVGNTDHPVPPDASSRGCGWQASVEVPIGADWPSGAYEVVFSPRAAADRPSDGTGVAKAFFVVRSRPDGPRAPILLQLATNTYNAYGNFGGYSLYAYNGRDGVQGSRVSFRRPLGVSLLTRWEAIFIRWAEAAGYRLDYAVNDDLEFHPDILEGRRLMLSVGHDEYWSTPMRDAVEGFVARGGNVAFFSGNTCCWQVRSEGDGLVCHKQNYRDDPLYVPDGPNPLLTTLWSHPLVARPENRLTNVGVLGGGFHRSHGILENGSGAFTVHRPDHWVFAGTGLARDADFGGDKTIVGYECDGCEFTSADGLPVPTGRDGTPKNFEILATAPASWGEESTLLWWDAFPRKEPGHACLGVSSRAPGGMVFTAGTIDWAHGLEAPADPVVERITRNVLDRLAG